jgi:hypothetical protein
MAAPGSRRVPGHRDPHHLSARQRRQDRAHHTDRTGPAQSGRGRLAAGRNADFLAAVPGSQAASRRSRGRGNRLASRALAGRSWRTTRPRPEVPRPCPLVPRTRSPSCPGNRRQAVPFVGSPTAEAWRCLTRRCPSLRAAARGVAHEAGRRAMPRGHLASRPGTAALNQATWLIRSYSQGNAPVPREPTRRKAMIPEYIGQVVRRSRCGSGWPGLARPEGARRHRSRLRRA